MATFRLLSSVSSSHFRKYSRPPRLRLWMGVCVRVCVYRVGEQLQNLTFIFIWPCHSQSSRLATCYIVEALLLAARHSGFFLTEVGNLQNSADPSFVFHQCPKHPSINVIFFKPNQTVIISRSVRLFILTVLPSPLHSVNLTGPPVRLMSIRQSKNKTKHKNQVRWKTHFA